MKALGLPKAQQNEISALTLLALCGLTPKDPWSAATRKGLGISLGIMDVMRQAWGKDYAPNTRETVRRQVVHQLIQARVADRNPFGTKATNSKDYHYALTEPALATIRAFGTSQWPEAVTAFEAAYPSLVAQYAMARQQDLVPITLPDGTRLELSPGQHNEVQKAIVEEFGARFAQGALPLYLGDTAKKGLHVDAARLERLGIPFTEHDKLPDVVLYHEGRNWLYLIEAVTSHGPMSPKRVHELRALLSKCPVEPVYVSAFPDAAKFRRYAADIAWETEVWLASAPSHMIHFNGEKFLGPHAKTDLVVGNPPYMRKPER